MEAEEKPAARADGPAPRANRDAVVGLGKVMEKVVDRVMEKMMERVMDRMAEKWRLENKGRIEQAVVETMNENIIRLAGEGWRSEQEAGKRVEELVDKVVEEVALLIDKMMQQVEQKLDRGPGRADRKREEGGGEEEDEEDESSSDGSVCQMPPPGHMRGDEDDCEDESEEDDILEEPPLTPNQREAFHEIFLQFSQSTNEVIDLSSLRTTLADIEIPMAEAEIYSTLEALDSDGDGEATFEDFLRLVTSTRLFFLFYRELPDRCEGSVPQTGAVDNTIFFEILSRFIQTQMLSEDTTRKIIRYYYRKKKGARLKSKKTDTKQKHILPPPMFLGQTIYSLATYVDILEPDEEYQDLPLNQEQIKAFQEIFDMFSLDKQNCIDINSLLDVMAEVQIYLKNPLIPNEMKCVEVNSGKEVSFQDFLAIMTDTATFGQYLAPEYEECKSTVATPVVIFQAINKLVSSPLLSAKTKGVVAAYYRNKFIAAAQGYGEEAESEQATSPETVAEPAEEKPRIPKPVPHVAKKPPGRPRPPREPAKCAKGSAKKSHSKKIKEPQLRRKQQMQRKFQAALRNPAFLEAFKVYSWTWKEKQAKQRQEGLLCA